MEQQVLSNKRVLAKAGIIAALTLALLLPAFLVMELVIERKARQEEVTREVGLKWGLPQTLSGFILAIPYNVDTVSAAGRTTPVKRYYVVHPRRNDISASMQVQLRRRSIYQVPLYEAQAGVNSRFDTNWQQLPNLPAGVQLTEALLCMPVSDAKGLKNDIEVAINANKILLNSEISLPGYTGTVLAGRINLSDAGTTAGFTATSTYGIRGSGSLFFHPNGKQNRMEMRSPWKHPSFQGIEVPDSNQVSGAGFTAVWTSNQQPLQPVPQYELRNRTETANVFGVAVLQPGDSYSKTLRTVKYAILVIALSFAMFFITELVKKVPVHALQYILVGAALVIFYTLLLAVSEYTSYNPAYLVASLATVLLIGWYTAAIYRSRSLGMAFMLFMGLLYAFIFIIIQLQDSALLVGSIGLFFVVAAGMYLTRRLNNVLAVQPITQQPQHA